MTIDRRLVQRRITLKLFRPRHSDMIDFLTATPDGSPVKAELILRQVQRACMAAPTNEIEAMLGVIDRRGRPPRDPAEPLTLVLRLTTTSHDAILYMWDTTRRKARTDLFVLYWRWSQQNPDRANDSGATAPKAPLPGGGLQSCDAPDPARVQPDAEEAARELTRDLDAWIPKSSGDGSKLEDADLE